MNAFIDVAMAYINWINDNLKEHGLDLFRDFNTTPRQWATQYSDSLINLKPPEGLF